MTMHQNCFSCGEAEMEPFYELDSVPTNSCILLSSPAEAKAYPRGKIILSFCPRCGFVSNTAFDAKMTEYSGRYEETQGFSPTFNAFHKQLAERLIDRFDLRKKDVIEIGCGKGAFINLLCELGDNRGWGFDPSYVDDRVETKKSKNVDFVTDFYSEQYANYHADFICCKMTLEHIHDTGAFINTVNLSVRDGKDTIVFFQVPEATRILQECAFEDIYYEHCSYFSPGSLARLFRKSGFDVFNLETEYDGQYLTVEARLKNGVLHDTLPDEDDLETLRQSVASFPQRCQEKLDHWQTQLDELHSAGKKVVLWGSGSKGVSFLTTLDTDDKIHYAVDINPYRQGYHMVGTGQAIVSPEFLKEYQPDAVIVMNAIYCEEIGRDLKKMGLTPELLPL